MVSFAEALRSHLQGSATRDELLAEVDRMLASTPDVARNLLTYLHAERNSERLPTDTYDVLMTRVRAWLDDRTVINRPPQRDDTVDVTGPGSRSPAFVPVHEDNIPPDSGGQFEPEDDDDQVSAPPAVGIGTVLLQRFELIEQVGEGGMSRVFKALDLRRVEANAPDPHIAVKVLTVRFADQFRTSAVLHREAHKLQSLTHPNIVRVIDCDRDGQTVFMTMEYLAGESLKSRIDSSRSSTLALPDALPIVSCIALALEFAHRNGIVHGDLKPGNVIVTDKGDVKVIDFGIARFISRSAVEHEEVSALTPPYASPEMLEGAVPDPRDDVYALACIAHELVTGEHPFNRLAANVARDQRLQLSRNDALTKSQYKAIRDALAFDRSERTATVREFLEQFKGRSMAEPRRYGVYALIAVLALAAGYLINSQVDKPAAMAPTAVDKSTPAEPGAVFRDCPTCPLMVVLPRGRFEQGSAPATDAAHAFEQPQHQVSIDYQIAMAQREVTIGEFREYIEATATHIAGCSVYDGEWQTRADVSWDTLDRGQTALHPVACVSWDDATAYTQWLSTKTQRQYRLASASEWEYAAGGGSEVANSGPRQVCMIANVADESAAQMYRGWNVHECRDGYTHAAPVGSFAVNKAGLADTLGNVFEWVQDCWHDNYDGAPSDGSAWLSGNCAEREMRGGSWFTSPGFVRPGYRNRFPRDYRSATVGFRVMRVIDNES